jgi:hypothetical protein
MHACTTFQYLRPTPVCTFRCTSQASTLTFRHVSATQLQLLPRPAQSAHTRSCAVRHSIPRQHLAASQQLLCSYSAPLCPCQSPSPPSTQPLVCPCTALIPCSLQPAALLARYVQASLTFLKGAGRGGGPRNMWVMAGVALLAVGGTIVCCCRPKASHLPKEFKVCHWLPPAPFASFPYCSHRRPGLIARVPSLAPAAIALLTAPLRRCCRCCPLRVARSDHAARPLAELLGHGNERNHSYQLLPCGR